MHAFLSPFFALRFSFLNVTTESVPLQCIMSVAHCDAARHALKQSFAKDRSVFVPMCMRVDRVTVERFEMLNAAAPITLTFHSLCWDMDE